MKWPKLTSRRMVIAYFACFALAWAILAVSLAGAPVPELTPGTLRSGRDAVNPVALLLVLALHAVLVVGLAWQAQRWFFARGALAVVVSGLPLFVLLGQLWFVPAFFHLIAVLHVWIACRHESIGKLQATHPRTAGTGRI